MRPGQVCGSGPPHRRARAGPLPPRAPPPRGRAPAPAPLPHTGSHAPASARGRGSPLPARSGARGFLRWGVGPPARWCPGWSSPASPSPAAWGSGAVKTQGDFGPGGLQRPTGGSVHTEPRSGASLGQRTAAESKDPSRSSCPQPALSVPPAPGQGREARRETRFPCRETADQPKGPAREAETEKPFSAPKAPEGVWSRQA